MAASSQKATRRHVDPPQRMQIADTVVSGGVLDALVTAAPHDI